MPDFDKCNNALMYSLLKEKPHSRQMTIIELNTNGNKILEQSSDTKSRV